MGGLITKNEREHRTGQILSFIFLFRFVTFRDLNSLGSDILDVNNMRRTIKYLLDNKLIKEFEISGPVKTRAYYLTDPGLAQLPDSLLAYKYSFWPARYRHGTFLHDAGVRKSFLGIQKTATKGYWISDWMIRQDKVKAKGKAARGLGWRHKSVLRGRLPDVMFIVGKTARIAVEYEDVRRNPTAWVDMIRDLEYRMKGRGKAHFTNQDIEIDSDFEAVLFVFGNKKTLSVYSKRLDDCVKFGKVGGQVVSVLKEFVTPERFYFTTLDELKEGKVYRAGGEENSLEDLFNFVQSHG